MAKKYLDDNGLLYFWQKIRNTFVSNITYDSSSFKIQKVKKTGANGAEETTDIVTLAKVATSGSYSDLSNKPTIPTLKNVFGKVKVGSTTIEADTTQDTIELVAGTNVTLTPDATNDKVTITATDTTYTAASATPLMDGTAAVGTSAKYAREDHVHPTDTSRVPTSRTVNGHALSSNVTVTKSDVGLGNVDNTADANKSVASAAKLTTGAAIDGVTFDGSMPIIHYAECLTSAATAAKTVTLTDLTFTLDVGAIIFVKFSVTNTAAVANLTLDVNGTGAKGIKYRNANLSSAGVLSANRFYCLVYDGTYWQIVGDLDTNTTYTNASLGQIYGSCSVAAGTAAKTVSMSSYVLTTGGIVSVLFLYGNTAANPTLNVNSKGAKAIWYRNAALTDTTLIEPGDVVSLMYDGTQYQIIAINRKPASEMVLATKTADGQEGLVPIPPKYEEPSSSDEDRPLDAYGGYSILTSAGWGKLILTSVLRPGDGDTVERGLSLLVRDVAHGTLAEASIDSTTLLLALPTDTADGIPTLNSSSKLSASCLPTATSSAYGAVKVDAALSTTSTNPVQNKAINTALSGKVSTSAIGAASGVCPLNSSSKVDDTYLNTATTSAYGVVKVDAALSTTSTNPVQNKAINTALSGKVSTSAIGAASGVCPLNASSKIDSTYLPSYVDDVIEAYPRSGQTELSSTWLSTTSGGSALTPESGKIYVLMADSDNYEANTQFRWSGTTYVKLSDGGVSAITNSEIDTIVAA